MFFRQPSLRVTAPIVLAGLACSVSLSAAAASDSAGPLEELQEVVITGSRIIRPNLDSTVPIATVGGDEIFQTGNMSLGDLLNNLPALRSTYSQSNSSRNLGTAGLNLLDLRGLGTQRTLVLVNGRRHVGADNTANAVSPDVNTFPSDLIERIDVVTGGSSSVYGSDAIAGVVNFVLKKNFEGLQFRAQGGQTKYDDGGSYFLSGVGGKNFSDGRGNVAVNLEYSAQKPVFGSNRPNLASVGNFVVVDTDPAGLAFGSDGVPDRTLFNDVRSTTLANGGLLQITPTAGLAPCGRDKDNLAFVCTYIFQPDGSLAAQTGTRVGLQPNGNFIGGNGSTTREGITLGVIPKLDRLSLNVVGHYTVSDAFEPFFEAKYVRTNSTRYGTPAFFQGATQANGDVRATPRFDNPFISDATRTAINAARAANGNAAATSATRLTLRRNLIDTGTRQEDARRETFRIVAGVTGGIADDWKYEISLNYGQFKEATKLLGNLNKQRFLLAMDATRDTSGNIVCRSKIDPAAAVILPLSGSDAYATSRLAGDVSACVPLNPFGEGSITREMRNYLIQDTTSIGRIQQFDALAFVSGDSSKWFSLPAGPIGIALGTEFRTEQNYYAQDELVAQGMTQYNAMPLFTPPTLGVKEFFGELRIPLLKELPAFQDLTLSAAARTSDYDSKTGRVTAYNGGIDWSPINDLRLRAGMARAVRAPNLSELFTAQGQNFATVVDPCSLRNIATGSATRAANCRAAGIPNSYDFVYTSSLGFLSGGNPDLTAEDSDSVTIGAVFRPRVAPDFSLSIDYFNIKVNDVIASVTAQQILNLCYDSASLNNLFCPLFRRAGANGGPAGEAPFQVLQGSLLQSYVNYSRRTAEGVDTELAYRRQLAGLGALNARLVYTHVLERNNYPDVTNTSKADRIVGELGDPTDAFNLDVDFTHDRLTLGWKLRYLGKMVLNTYEDTYSVQGRDAENADYADQRYYPSVWYTDLRMGYDVTRNVNAYIGVDNVWNKIPPLGLTGTTDGSGIYEAKGRFFYAGVKAKLF